MRSRSGFSFAEVLGALVIVGLLAAVTMPVVSTQIAGAELQQFTRNGATMKDASLMFLSNVGAYPGRPSQLLVQPVGGTAKDLFGATISTGRAAKWKGSYIDTDSLGYFAAGKFGLGVTVADTFVVKSSNGSPFLTAVFVGASRSDQLRLKKEYDNGTGLEAADSLTGLVRYHKDSVFYLLTVAR